jgi:hypothetical protein
MLPSGKSEQAQEILNEIFDAKFRLSRCGHFNWDHNSQICEGFFKTQNEMTLLMEAQ